jgi:hypothetical protein
MRKTRFHLAPISFTVEEVRRGRRPPRTSPISYARALTLAAIVAGAGLVLWLASIPEPRAGVTYSRAGQVVDTLADGRQIGQIIREPLDDLVGFRLWLQRPADPGSGMLLLRVRSLDQAKDLAVIEIPVSRLAPDGPTTFELAPPSIQRTRMHMPETLELMLTTQGVDQGRAIGVLASGNRYGYGLMLRDGKEITRSDLLFEVLYRGSLFDRILPITRIAYSRPGVLGWAPLYALIVYAVLVGLGLFVGALIGDKRPMLKS